MAEAKSRIANGVDGLGDLPDSSAAARRRKTYAEKREATMAELGRRVKYTLV